MDLEITSTGKVFRRVDPCLAGILCEAFPASFKRHEVQPKPAVAGFGVKRRLHTEGCLAYRVRGAQTEFYEGLPSGLLKHWPDCPIDVHYEYVLSFIFIPSIHGTLTPAIEAAEAECAKKLGLPPLPNVVPRVGISDEERAALPEAGYAHTGPAE